MKTIARAAGLVARALTPLISLASGPQSLRVDPVSHLRIDQTQKVPGHDITQMMAQDDPAGIRHDIPAIQDGSQVIVVLDDRTRLVCHYDHGRAT